MDSSASPDKSKLRKTLRKARRDHVAAQPDSIRALLFHKPPVPLLSRISDEATIGLYNATTHEAPTKAYAQFFFERGQTIALPHFADRETPMRFRQHTDPHSGSDLSRGPFGMLQPSDNAKVIVPDLLFVPLIGFTEEGARLGQGGGHYDRWLSEHPGRLAIGLAWDAQRCESLPVEPHDVALDAVITPTRIYGLE